MSIVMDEQPKGTMQMLDKLPPRLAFWAGVVVTAGTIFAIGFIVLIVLMFKGIDFPSSDTSSDTGTTTTGNTDTAAVTDVAVDDTTTAAATGKIELASLRNIQGEGDYTVVEYSDIDCPFCKRFHPTMQQVMENYDGKVRWAYKHLPLTSLHPNAMEKALASECAADQGKFWEYLDTLIANEVTDAEETNSVADEVGLDRTAFDDCLANQQFKDRVTEDSNEAQTLGGRGTPFSVIIDKDGNVVDAVEGALPYDSVAQALDAIL